MNIKHKVYGFRIKYYSYFEQLLEKAKIEFGENIGELYEKSESDQL